VFLIPSQDERVARPAQSRLAMAQHKAPTAVTFATPEDNSGLKPFVQTYWKLGALLALVVGGVVIYLAYSAQQHKKHLDDSWDSLHRITQVSETSLLAYDAKPADIVAGEASIRGTQAGPWALWIAATQASDAGEWDTALQALAQLKQNYPTHTLVVDAQPIGPEGSSVSMVAELERRYQAQRDWRASHAAMFANPEPPADSPKVRIKTDKGDILVALYAKEAPKHVENFLKLAREGYYANTKFHRVVRNFMIQGGDPNSKTEDRATWGQGGPGYKIDREENNLHHFAGYLAAAKMSMDTQSSGSQFYIPAADRLSLDGGYVVFGKVLEGMSVVHAIEQGEIDPTTSDRPQTPAVVLSTEVL
jgi:cyclophilin family peptidyl-prolyl cis-trans isomerase